MNKEAELKRAKRLALSLLCLSAAVFVTTLFLPPNFWVSGAKAIAEAAMVGALADWFAVVALFRRVPLPVISRHTAIIPRNKARIADNLARFVQDKFLDTESLLALIRRHNPVQLVGRWLQEPGNAERLGSHLLQFMRGMLDMADDRHIQRFIRRAVHQAIDKVDLTQSVAVLLDSLTKNNRHQQLLDTVIDQLLKGINKPSTREFIAAQIVRWLKREHPVTEKILPSEWLGERSAEVVANAVNTLLDEVVRDQGHELRQHVDRSVARLIVRLQADPEMLRRAEAIKLYLKNDEALNRYLSDLWRDLRAWLKADLNQSDSAVSARLSAAGHWLGHTLMQDEELRFSLNRHLEEAVHTLGPEFTDFLTRHISDTVNGWDAQEMSHQVELNIGKDLQFIRINGTLVGGSIGLGLYLLSQLPDLINALRAAAAL